ncbi:hypothetical protein P4132_17285 [Pseudomonas aeruginosa]|nr:hypothetical protein [Pseudomonas aeruginosa]
MITADEGVRGGKRTPLKANVDDALTNPETSSVQKSSSASVPVRRSSGTSTATSGTTT